MIQNKKPIKLPIFAIPWRSVYIRVLQNNRQVNISRKFVFLFRKGGIPSRKISSKPTFHTPILPPVPASRWPAYRKLLQDLSVSLYRFLLEKFKQKRTVFAVFALMSVSFVFGMAVVLTEHKTEANTEIRVNIAEANTAEVADLEIFASTSIELLNGYNQIPQGPDQLQVRRAKLKKYLQEKGSPFAEDEILIGTLLSLPHMKLIISISYAESTMGRNCYYNNCSGIGGYVPNLRQYKEFRNWAIDLNDLLERRYKGWTLNEMCGVYVQPCNSNWLKANRQVLDQLAEREIN